MNEYAVKSLAVLEAEKRRIARAATDAQRLEWFANEVMQKVNLSLEKRVKIAVQYLQSQIVRNISRPVTKTVRSRVVVETTVTNELSDDELKEAKYAFRRGEVDRQEDFADFGEYVEHLKKTNQKEVKKKKTIHMVTVSDRSKPGEFPKADTTLLMKSIFHDVAAISETSFEGYVGTPVDYGVTLELYRNRSFMVRTFNESLGVIRAILTGPIDAGLIK